MRTVRALRPPPAKGSEQREYNRAETPVARLVRLYTDDDTAASARFGRIALDRWPARGGATLATAAKKCRRSSRPSTACRASARSEHAATPEPATRVASRALASAARHSAGAARVAPAFTSARSSTASGPGRAATTRSTRSAHAPGIWVGSTRHLREIFYRPEISINTRTLDTGPKKLGRTVRKKKSDLVRGVRACGPRKTCAEKAPNREARPASSAPAFFWSAGVKHSSAAPRAETRLGPRLEAPAAAVPR